MTTATDPYRKLQEHLDGMPVGYPATESGVEINLLKETFTPEQAHMATYLDYKHQTVDQIFARIKEGAGSEEELQELLDEMVARGGIARRERDGAAAAASQALAVGQHAHGVRRTYEHHIRQIVVDF